MTLLYRMRRVSRLSRCVACVEILGPQARTPTMRSLHEHAFLESHCASDSELAAKEVKRSVVIRVTSCEDLQLVSMWSASRHSLRSCNAHDVVVHTWVLFPCEAGAHCGCINEKLSVEIGGLGMTCKLEVTAFGLCRHDVRICDEFCRVWSNGSDIWKWVNVRNLFAWCGSFSCLVSKAVDSEEGVFCVKMVKTFGRVAGAARIHVFHHSMLVAIDNADGNGINASVQPPYAMAIHGDSSQRVPEEASLQLAGNAANGKFREKLCVYNDALRNVCIDPIENNFSAVRDEISLESAEDYFDSGLFMPRARLLQHGLNGYNELRHLRCRFPNMRVDDVLSFKQFDLDAALPGYVSFLAASDDPNVIRDAPMKQGMECHASLVLPHTEPKASPALSPDAMENEPASHVERGTWDLLVVRVMSEWMQDDAHSEAFVGHAVLILSVKFAETGCRDPATTTAVVGSTVLRTPRGEWKYRGNSVPYGPYGRLSLNSLNMSVRLQFAEIWSDVILKSFDIEIPWFMDTSWFTDVLKAIG